MKARGQLQLAGSVHDVLSDTAWAGRGFHGTEYPEFAELKKYIDDTTAAARKASYPAAAQELIRLMKTDPQMFARSLVLSNHAENRYFKVPVLVHAEVGSFVNVLMELQAPALSTVTYTIQNRYEHFRADLADEKHWLEDLVRQLKPKVSERKGSMTGFWLNTLREKAIAAAASLAVPQ